MKILLLVLLSINVYASATKRPAPEQTVTPTPTATASPVQATGETVTFTCKVCNASEKAMLPKMQKLLNEVKNSKCFAERFIDPKYRSKLVQTDGLTREQVVSKLQTTVVKDIPLVFYKPGLFQSKSVIGYTIPGSPEIYLNRNFRGGSWGICAEVSNELHEASHKMGFGHDYKATAQRPYSVPYTVNYAVDSCCDDKTGAKP